MIALDQDKAQLARDEATLKQRKWILPLSDAVAQRRSRADLEDQVWAVKQDRARSTTTGFDQAQELISFIAASLHPPTAGWGCGKSIRQLRAERFDHRHRGAHQIESDTVEFAVLRTVCRRYGACPSARFCR